MTDNIFLDLKPNRVSKQLESYAYLIAGGRKTGKTTELSHFPNSVILEFEKGAHCIPGSYRVPIKNWDDFEAKIRLLERPETKERFSMIIIDTAEKCFKFACDKIVNQYNIKMQNASLQGNNRKVEYMEDMSDVTTIAGTRGNHWNKAYDLLDNAFTKIFKQLNYGLGITTHLTEKQITIKKGEEDVTYTVVDYALNERVQRLINELVDVSCIVKNEKVKIEGTDQVVIQPMCYFRSDGHINSGNRFKYLNGKVPFKYENFSHAILKAIEKEEEELGLNEFYTEEKIDRDMDDSGVNSYSMTKKIIECQIGNLNKKYKDSTTKPFKTFWKEAILKIIASHSDKNLNELTEKDVDVLIQIKDDIQSFIEENS